MNIFVNAHHDLRSGWKFLAYVALFVIFYIASALVLFSTFQDYLATGTSLAVLALNAAAMLIPAVLAFAMMLRLVDRLPAAAFGVGFHEGWWRDAALGIAIAAVMLLTFVVGSAVIGDIHMQWSVGPGSGGAIVTTTLILLVSAANEELIFRGYPMQVLMRGIGAWPAMLVMSSIFGLLHLTNPNTSALSTLNTVIAGLMLSIAYLKTRSLWLPYGIHVGWNVGTGVVLGVPLSGVDIESLWVTAVEGAPQWLGGQYGPEGGLLGTLIFVVAAVAVYATRAAGVSPRIRAALASHPEKLYLPENS